MNNLFSKNNIHTNIFIYLIGRNNVFKTEHQFFNIVCLMGGVFNAMFIVINILFKIDLSHTLIKLVGAVSCFIIYYFSRFKHIFSWTSFFFFINVLLSYLYIGVKNGGVTGGATPIYIAVLTLMLFITEGAQRRVLFTLWVLSFSSLFVLEYYLPDIITPYSNNKQKYLDIYLSYFSGIVVVAFVVVSVKKLYKKEQLTVEEQMMEYRTYGADLKEIFDKKMMLLSIRERDICKLLLKGQSNKEIADNLFITEGTVKSHLNKIYKKLGTCNRVEVINLMGKI